MTSRERQHPQDEPVIGLNYPGYDEPESSDNGYDDGGAYIGSPDADGFDGDPESYDPVDQDEEWGDEYEDPYDDYYYDDEYYEAAPARQPLFYVIIGLAVILGGLLLFLVFQLLGGNGDSTVVDPDFNIRIDEPLPNARVDVDADVNVRIRATATEPITAIQLFLDGERVDEQTFTEVPDDDIYSATLQFRVEEPESYTLIARAVSESGATSDSDPVTVVARESIDERPSSILGEVITSVNAREGPGDEYDAVRTISAGETVTIVGRTRDSEWLLLEDGTWVRAAAIRLSESIDLVEVREPTPEPEPTETPEAEPSPSPTPVVNAPDFMPTNASFDSGGSLLRVTVANLSSSGYEGSLVVRVTGLSGGTREQAFAVNIGPNGATAVEFSLSPAHTEGATIQVTVDPDGAVEEMSEDNNAASFVLAPPVEEPNLVISNVENAGSTINVTVQNDGGQLATSEVTVQVALGNTTNQAGDTIALAHGQSQTFNVSTPPGSGQATVHVLVNGEQVASTTIQLGDDDDD